MINNVHIKRGCAEEDGTGLPTSAGTLFYFLHLLFICSVYLLLTSCHSPLVFCPFKKYIELFTLLHAWYGYCHSLWKQIREKFLGHVCETCQRILIIADMVYHCYVWTWSREVCLNVSIMLGKFWNAFHNLIILSYDHDRSRRWNSV